MTETTLSAPCTPPPSHSLESDAVGAVNLLGLDRHGMEALFVGMGEKPFRATQILPWIHRMGVLDLDAMTNIGKALRARLRAMAHLTPPGDPVPQCGRRRNP